MTVKDIKKQIAPYSTTELHLWELAIYQELEERGEMPVFQDDPKVMRSMKTLDEGIDAGTVKTISVDEFKNRMAKRRAS